jgi:hypothetical protein
MNTKKFKCCLCGSETEGFGNNPYPLGNLENDEKCCDICNSVKVISARIELIIKGGSLESLYNTKP